jgi:hypothetical protein
VNDARGTTHGGRRVAILLVALGGCGHAGRAVATSAPTAPAGARVDASFARRVLEVLEAERAGQGVDTQPLRDHPAVLAVMRHRRLTGDAGATADSTLALMLRKAREAPPSRRVLAAWAGREEELTRSAGAAAAYLPAGSRFEGTVLLMAGYDIGVPAPPDIALNVGHRHYTEAPDELGFYATHEAHHVGFLAVRPMPSLEHLDDPAHLREVIAYLTQLQGMAVHAAYPGRVAAGALAGDGDYRVYGDAAEAARVTRRYGELLSRWPTPLTESFVGELLDTLSTNERVWYRFGALVARELERRQGRDALIASIAQPAAFVAQAEALMREAGVSPAPSLAAAHEGRAP